MLELRNPKIAVPVVLIAGLIWSFGPLVVRNMNDPHLIPWQYIFGRGLTIFILLNLYLYFEEGKNFYKNYFKMGLSGLIGGSGLGIAMITLVDDAKFVAESFSNWLWVCFTRSNPSHDVYGLNMKILNKHFSCSIPIIDARIKPHHAPILSR